MTERFIQRPGQRTIVLNLPRVSTSDVQQYKTREVRVLKKIAPPAPPKAPRMKRNSMVKGPAVWKCTFCSKFLSSKRSYLEHMNIHTDSRPFECQYCEYAAASQMTLRRHVLRNHTSPRDWGYKCPYCSQSYMEPASYQQHVQSRHYGRSATYGCPYTLCPFTTKSFRHFREHLAKHDTVEEFGGPPDKFPYSRTDQELLCYLVDDDCGVGYSTTKKRIPPRGQKTVLFTNDRISRGPVNVINYPPPEGAPPHTTANKHDDFMKEPLHIKPRGPPRKVIHTPYEVLDMPPILDEEEFLPAESDWIENEIELHSSEPIVLPDGQVELELD